MNENALRELMNSVSLGTTIMAAAYDGGVVLGADSRTATGNYVANRAADKLTKLSDKVYVCRSGSAADTQNVSAYLQWFLEQHAVELGEEVEVRTAAHLAMRMAYTNKNMLSAGLIVAGWDKHEGGSVYAIPLGGTLVKAPFALGGSGSAYITGFCDKAWKENMTKEECIQFVAKSVSLAVARDGSSGGCIRMVVIDKSGPQRHFVPNPQVPVYGDELQAPAVMAA